MMPQDQPIPFSGGSAVAGQPAPNATAGTGSAGVAPGHEATPTGHVVPPPGTAAPGATAIPGGFDDPKIDEGVVDQRSTALQRTGASQYQTSFEDDALQRTDVTNYKGRENVIDRLAVIDPALLIVSRTHFHEKLGYVLCGSEFDLKGGVEVMVKGKEAVCCRVLDEARKRCTTLVVVYDTDARGQLVKPLGYKLAAWTFDVGKFETLRGIHREWKLTEHDLLVTCTDPKFQKMTFTIAKQRVISDPAFQARYGKDIQAWVDGMKAGRLNKVAGKAMSEREMLEKLGRASGPATVARMDEPAENIADLIG